MTQRILLLASHAVAEFDDIRMFTDLGYDVFCPGGYQDPRVGVEGMRPGIPNGKVYPELIAACERARAEHGPVGDFIDWAKARIPMEVLDWCDVIVAHHFLDRWVVPQWTKFQRLGKRVVWRTCGQSSPQLELTMKALRREGLEIVRYSPTEEFMPGYAGLDTLIRFGKYPQDYGPWTGENGQVVNIAQHDRVPHGRDFWLTWRFWEAATADLPTEFAGPWSELVGGIGPLSWNAMRDWLRKAGAFLYTGTVSAPYTLGLIEAMLSGVPVVSVGSGAWNGPDELFEADRIAGISFDDPAEARAHLALLLRDPLAARAKSASDLNRALSLFDVNVVGPQWRTFLG